MNINRNLVAAVLMTIVTTLLLGVIYPLAITGDRAGRVSGPGQRSADRARRHGGRVADHRAGLLVARLLPARGRRPPARAMTRPIPQAASSARRTRS